MTKTYTVDYFKDRKLKWEKNHGKFIHEFMFNEFQTRILGQCNTALNDLQRQLDLEIARAKAEEARIEAKAHNELGKIYNYINPSSSTYEDALEAQEPLKYTELAHVDGDFLAENGEKDLNSAYNRSMTVLTEAFNSFKNKQISKSDLEKVYNACKFRDVDLESVLSAGSLPKFNKIFRGLVINRGGAVSQDENPRYIEDAFAITVRTLKELFFKLDHTIYPYADCNVDTNELDTITPDRANKKLPNALSDSYNAIAQAHHAINNLYMVNNTDSYTLNDEGKLTKNAQQTKLISKYNDTIMYITQALNQLRVDHDSLVTRVSILENNHQ